MKNTADAKDEDLLHLYAAGDARAAHLLTSRLLPRVYRHAFRMLGNASEAEDVAQDAMMRLWKIAPNWRRGEAQISTWLYRVTANLCLDRLRRHKRMSSDEADEPVDPSLSVTQKMQNASRNAALQSALLELPDRQRQAVVLRHLEGLGNAQIAQTMDITPRAVESLIARGKRALADLLERHRAELGYEDEVE